MGGRRFVEQWQSIVVVTRCTFLALDSKRNGKVVAQRVDNDHHRLVKALWVPASSIDRAGLVFIRQWYWRDRAFRLVVENQTSEEKATEEEV